MENHQKCHLIQNFTRFFYEQSISPRIIISFSPKYVQKQEFLINPVDKNATFIMNLPFSKTISKTFYQNLLSPRNP